MSWMEPLRNGRGGKDEHARSQSLVPPFIYFIFSPVQPLMVRWEGAVSRHSAGSPASAGAGSCQDSIRWRIFIFINLNVSNCHW